MKKTIISIKNLSVTFLVKKQFLTAIKNIDFDIYQNETLAIVGESGSGKTVLTRMLTNLNEANGYASNGSITYFGTMPKCIKGQWKFDLLQLHYKTLEHANKKAFINQLKKTIIATTDSATRLALSQQLQLLQTKYTWKEKSEAHQYLQAFRGGVIGNIFQDPMTSLNPLLTVGTQLCDVIKLHQCVPHEQAKKIAIDLLDKVGIVDPEKAFSKQPIAFSGGQKQRIVIAIVLAAKPNVLVADEPTTALDVTIQKQILSLIMKLKDQLNFTLIFITHDLSLVANIADRVAVMYNGNIVEYGTCREIFADPRHPYTWALLSSLPQLTEKHTELYTIKGNPPSLNEVISGDPFAKRNEYALAIDFKFNPPLFAVSPTHYARTWLLDKRAPKIKIPNQILLLKKGIKNE